MAIYDPGFRPIQENGDTECIVNCNICSYYEVLIEENVMREMTKCCCNRLHMMLNVSCDITFSSKNSAQLYKL